MVYQPDKNSKAIDEIFLKFGWSVLKLDKVGDGCPDRVYGKGTKNILVEIKNENGKLRPKQVKFFQDWKGPRYLIRTVDEAIQLAT